MAGKRDQLGALATKRRATRLEGYASLGDFHAGGYECEHVSPWTRSAQNVDSPLMLVAQDWASSDYLNGPWRPFLADLGYDPKLPTNIRLQRLLHQHFGMSFADTYATNLFPFIKLGDMSSGIPAAAMGFCAKEFLIPQIEIVDPKLVVCLGLQTFNGLRRALGMRPTTPLDMAIAQPFRLAGAMVWAAVHTGALGANQRGADRVDRDWSAMGSQLFH